MPGEEILARKVFAQSHIAEMLGIVFSDEGAHFVAEGLLFGGEFEVHMLKLRFLSPRLGIPDPVPAVRTVWLVAAICEAGRL